MHFPVGVFLEGVNKGAALARTGKNPLGRKLL